MRAIVETYFLLMLLYLGQPFKLISTIQIVINAVIVRRCMLLTLENPNNIYQAVL